ncbi:MAG: hypothetical protein KGI29_01150 [Pseudomonadota bacterium]|nr:hypothetical protein [Pseudomonadota bacterium]MDE3038601.1 hypothetical protein [Pseudomonadota bacterium]
MAAQRTGGFFSLYNPSLASRPSFNKKRLNYQSTAADDLPIFNRFRVNL